MIFSCRLLVAGAKICGGELASYPWRLPRGSAHARDTRAIFRLSRQNVQCRGRGGSRKIRRRGDTGEAPSGRCRTACLSGPRVSHRLFFIPAPLVLRDYGLLWHLCLVLCHCGRHVFAAHWCVHWQLCSGVDSVSTAALSSPLSPYRRMDGRLRRRLLQHVCGSPLLHQPLHPDCVPALLSGAPGLAQVHIVPGKGLPCGWRCATCSARTPQRAWRRLARQPPPFPFSTRPLSWSPTSSSWSWS